MKSQRPLLLSLSLLVAVAGCDGAAPASDAGSAPGDAGPVPSPVVRYFAGVYFVPERTDVSTYPVDEAEWVAVGDEVVLAYNLPRLLTGRSERVAFRGTVAADGRTAELSSDQGTASCELAPDGTPRSCLERFTNIDVDLARVRETALDQDPSRVDERVAVSTRFSTDPIGVIEREDVLYGPAELASCLTDADCGGRRCDVEIPGQPGFCEPEGPDLPLGAACELSFECAADLECDHEDAGSTCQPHGGNP